MNFALPMSNRQRASEDFRGLSEGLIRALGIVKQAKDDEDGRADRVLARQIQQSQLAASQQNLDAGAIQLRGAKEEERLQGALGDFQTREVTPGAAGPVTPEEAAVPSPLSNRSRGEAFKDNIIAQLRTRRDPGNPITPDQVALARADKATARERDTTEFGLRKSNLEATTANTQADAAKTRRETELLGKPKPEAIVEQNKFARQLKQDFLGNQIVKDYQIIERSAKTMETALKGFRERDAEARKTGKTIDRSALDQTLITLFNKLLDPSSVVRESEYARTPDGMAKMEGLRGKLEAIAKGGPGITDSFRDELIASADILVKAAEQGFQSHVLDTVADAQSYGIEPERVVGGYSRYLSQDGGAAPAAAGPAQVGTPEEYAKLPPGTLYMDPNGVQRRKK